MPILSCYVDDRTLAILQREAEIRGRTPEQLAEAAIENEAIKAEHDAPLSHRQLDRGTDRQHRPRWGMGTHDDPALGRESELRPGFYEGDMP